MSTSQATDIRGDAVDPHAAAFDEALRFVITAAEAVLLALEAVLTELTR